MKFKAGVFSGLFGLAAAAAAHEDLDLGITSLTLDTRCRAVVTVANAGHTLPGSFYHFPNPAYIELQKGEQTETLASLRDLDSNRDLKYAGGAITITGATVFSHNPEPMVARVVVGEEFGDYGTANSYREEVIDCVPGIGQIAGKPVQPEHPDIAIARARVNPHTCELELELHNLTGVPLGEQSWQLENGVSLAWLNLDNHQRANELPLARLDPDKRFTRSGQSLQWKGPLPFAEISKLRVSLWRVTGDPDFSNNTAELAVPAACSGKR